MSQKRLIDSLRRLGCCYYQVQQTCCRQIRPEIANCRPVLLGARSYSYLLLCQYLLLEINQIKKTYRQIYIFLPRRNGTLACRHHRHLHAHHARTY